MFFTKDVHKISIVGGLLLLGLTLTTGITVYNAMRQQIETVLGRGLTGALEGKALLFQTRVEKGIEDTRALALRPFIVQFMQDLNDNIDNEIASNNLTRNVNSLTLIGFSAAAVYDRNNNVLSQVGVFSSNENPIIPLDSDENSKLIWDNVFVLRVTVNVFNQGNRIGRITTETRLPNLTRSFRDIQSIGKSVEFLICAKLSENRQAIACLINSPASIRFTHLGISYNKEGGVSPKEMALEGKNGVASAVDYRNVPVIEAYTPLPAFGIVMLLKLDQDELFMPVTDRLKDITFYLVALILAEILLLNWFIRKLISSEKEARQSKVKAEEYSIELTNKEKELRKRLKEITCLYEIRQEMELEVSIDGVCQKIFKHLIPALQFPHTSVAEILINDKRYVSQDYDKNQSIESKSTNLIEIIKPVRSSDRKSIFNFFIHSDIYINHKNHGYLRVYYTQDAQSSNTEEQKLIDAIASVLEGWIELRQVEEALVSVAEGQVHKIGQELHDNIGQQIAAVAFQASVLEVQTGDTSVPRERISELAASIALQTQNLVVNIKQLSKVLLPFELETNGLISALQTLATRISETYNVVCKFTNNISDEDVGSVIALNMYRVAQEAINNAVIHGKARHISISLTIEESNEKLLHLTISDDGQGFDESESGSEEDLFSGMGIKIMHYRAKQLDGKLKILRRNVSGVEVHFIVPVNQGDN
ncbi:MAG: ATP-binding protein [Nitrosomonas ureae]